MHLQSASRRPDVRDCLLAAAARRTLGVSSRQVAAAVGIDYSTLTNHESCRYRLGRAKERELLTVLLKMYGERGVATNVRDDATMDEIRLALATAVVALKSQGLFPLAQGLATAEGAEDVVDLALQGVLLQFQGGAADRLRELLAVADERG